MPLPGNNSEVDLSIHLISLKRQVNLIWLSRVIKDPLQLEEKCGINKTNIHYILQNQKKILQKWIELSQPLHNSAEQDDIEGIDALLLDWINRCKMNKIQLRKIAIKSQATYLTQILKVSSYYIKPKTWNFIQRILNGQSIVNLTTDISVTPFTILKFLESDGNRSLKPHTRLKFLQALELSADDVEQNSKINTEEQKRKTLLNVLGTHFDDCHGIDLLLLNWVACSKMNRVKLTKTAIQTQVTDFADILNVSPYSIKSNIWNVISEILYDESNFSMETDTKCFVPCTTLLQCLKTDGSCLLKPETYHKFLRTIETNSLDIKEKEKYELNTLPEGIKAKMEYRSPNKTDNDLLDTENIMFKSESESLYREKQQNVAFTSTTDFFPLLSNNLMPDTENTKVLTIKTESQDSFSDQTNTNATSAVVIKTEIVDGNKKSGHNEFKIYERQPSVNEEIKQEFDNMAKDNSDSIKIIQNVERGAEVNQNEVVKTLQDLDGSFMISNKKIIMEPCGYREIEIKQDCDKLITTSKKLNNATKKLATYITDDENDAMQVVFEIEDSDEKLQNELTGILNKYTKENLKNCKQENLIMFKNDKEQQDQLEESEPDDEVLTVIEIISDDDDDESSNISKKDLIKDLANKVENPLGILANKINSVDLKNLKRSRNNIEDNLPSTSQSATLASHATSTQPTKKICLNSTESEVGTNLSINSSVEAFKYLHRIKKYFQSQNDEVAFALTTKLMTSFMISSGTPKRKSS